MWSNCIFIHIHRVLHGWWLDKIFQCVLSSCTFCDMMIMETEAQSTLKQQWNPMISFCFRGKKKTLRIKWHIFHPAREGKETRKGEKVLRFLLRRVTVLRLRQWVKVSELSIISAESGGRRPLYLPPGLLGHVYRPMLPSSQPLLRIHLQHINHTQDCFPISHVVMACLQRLQLLVCVCLQESKILPFFFVMMKKGWWWIAN